MIARAAATLDLVDGAGLVVHSEFATKVMTEAVVLHRTRAPRLGGLNQSASEVIRDGLRLMRERDELHQSRVAELRRDIDFREKRHEQAFESLQPDKSDTPISKRFVRRYRISLVSFVLSGETDLERFVPSCRRR
jgi:Arc/MetJ-type ribon-helix-helix transcriptional regulator